MKHLFFSFIVLPIALIFGTFGNSQTVAEGGPGSDSTIVKLVRMDSGFGCCGGDIEDPIIRGLVQNNLSQPISNANVEVFEDGNPTSLGSVTTDSNGEFEVQVIPGGYYFKITPSGCSTTTTSVYSIGEDTDLTFTL